MQNVAITLTKILLTGCLVFQIGCSRTSVDIKPNPAAPRFSPTSAVSVEILSKAPSRKNVRLGEIVMQPRPQMADLELNMQLRRAAAEMGANAAVIKSSENFVIGSSGRGSLYESMTSTVRIIKADAIRYTE